MSPRALRLLALLVAADSTAAQGHFPADSVVRAAVRQVIQPRGRVGVVVGMLEADGTRRFVTVGDASYDRNTLYEIGSITKVFTGIVLGDMTVRGEARLDQPVKELLPDSVTVPSRAGREIRLVDLTTHMSGLPRMPNNFEPADWRNPFIDYSADRLYAFLRSYRLERDIGALSEYSNVGVGLLGYALSLRADTSYNALVRTRILTPLGMSSTMIEIPDSVRHRLAPGHNANGDSVSNWDLNNTMAGAGALRSTADDMLTFLAANLSPDTTTLGRAIRLSHVMHYRRDATGSNGLGWGIQDNRFGRRMLQHAGGTAGYTTYAAFDPERRIGVVVLINQLATPGTIGTHLLDPRNPLSSAGLQRAFRILAITLVALLTVGVFVAWRRTGATMRRAVLVMIATAIGLTLWLALTHTAAALQLLEFEGKPPTMMMAVALTVVLSAALGLSSMGRRLAAGLPLAVLVGVHAFRLPLELMMHRAYAYGLMPVQMSYSGLNFDVLTGILAIVLAVLLATGRVGVREVRIWNLLGIVLLVNVVTIALLSAPTPLRMFKHPPSNVWITGAPYIWLPTVMVGFAILGHIVVFRRLRTAKV